MDLYHKTHLGSSSSWDFNSPSSVYNTESSPVTTTCCCVWRRSFSVRSETTNVCWRSLNGCQCLMIWWVMIYWRGMGVTVTLETSSPLPRNTSFRRLSWGRKRGSSFWCWETSSCELRPRRVPTRDSDWDGTHPSQTCSHSGWEVASVGPCVSRSYYKSPNHLHVV